MLLNDQQIEMLFAFTKKKFVHYYDLQVELVDHLATSIEEEMQADPSVTFDHALQKVYNRFGIFGFAKVVQEREAALLKNNKRIWWKAVKLFFTIPKLFVSLTIFLAALYLGNFISPDVRGMVVFATWLAFSCVEIRHTFLARRNCTKKLLLLQYTSVFSLSGFMFPYWLFVMNKIGIHANVIFALVMVIVFVVELAIIQVNTEVRKKAESLYPEAFKAA